MLPNLQKRNWQLYLQILMLKNPRMTNLYVMKKCCSTLLLTCGHPPEGTLMYSVKVKGYLQLAAGIACNAAHLKTHFCFLILKMQASVRPGLLFFFPPHRKIGLEGTLGRPRHFWDLKEWSQHVNE